MKNKRYKGLDVIDSNMGTFKVYSEPVHLDLSLVQIVDPWELDEFVYEQLKQYYDFYFANQEAQGAYL